MLLSRYISECVCVCEKPIAFVHTNIRKKHARVLKCWLHTFSQGASESLFLSLWCNVSVYTIPIRLAHRRRRWYITQRKTYLLCIRRGPRRCASCTRVQRSTGIVFYTSNFGDGNSEKSDSPIPPWIIAHIWPITLANALLWADMVFEKIYESSYRLARNSRFNVCSKSIVKIFLCAIRASVYYTLLGITIYTRGSVSLEEIHRGNKKMQKRFLQSFTCLMIWAFCAMCTFTALFYAKYAYILAHLL